MAVKRISELDSAVGIQDSDLLAIVNGGVTRKTTVADLNTVILNSSNPRRACRIATTANVDLTAGGLLTVDGVLLQNDDRVLVWRQTNAAQNGIYDAKPGAWVRAFDFDETSEIRSGALIPVVQGNTYKQSIFQLTNIGSIIIGTSNITFARLTGWLFNEATNIVSLTDRAVHIPSLQINGGLAKYDAERHSQFDARTLVDKEYVDDRVSSLDPQWATIGNDLYYNTGNVGIGVSSPTADLHVQGSFKFIDGNQQSGKILTSDNAGNASWQPIPVNALWSPGAGNNIYYNLGSVGIGTANPAQRLHVVGNVVLENGGLNSQGGDWAINLGTSGQPAAPARIFGVHTYFAGNGGASFYVMPPGNSTAVFDYSDATFNGTRPWLLNISPAGQAYGGLLIKPNSLYLSAWGARVVVEGNINGGQQSRIFKGYETFFNTPTVEGYPTYNDQIGFSAVMTANNSQLKGFYADVQSSAAETWAFYAKNGKSLFRDVFLATAPANDNTLTQVLVRDNTTGQIKYRDAGTLGGGGGGTQTLASVLTTGNDAGGLAIINLDDPTNAQDAVTKAYVDSVVPPSNSDLYSRFFTDFIDGNNSTQTTIGFNRITSAGGVCVFGITSSADVLKMQGAATLTYSNLSGSYVALYKGQGQVHFGNDWTIIQKCRIAIGALSDGTNRHVIRIGYRNYNSFGGIPTEGAYFRYTDDVNLGKFEAVCVSDGTETVADTGVTATVLEDYILEIIVNSTGTSVAFKIDGATVATITTNIPTEIAENVTMTYEVQRVLGGTGGAASNLIVDWDEHIFQRTIPR